MCTSSGWNNKMNAHDQIFALAWGFAICASFNWAAGDRSVFGKPHYLRSTFPWFVSRWFGAGIFLATSMAGPVTSLLHASLSLAGAGILLVGTARFKPARG